MNLKLRQLLEEVVGSAHGEEPCYVDRQGDDYTVERCARIPVKLLDRIQEELVADPTTDFGSGDQPK